MHKSVAVAVGLITALIISCRSPQRTTSVDAPTAAATYAPITSARALEIARQAALAWNEPDPMLLGLRRLSRREFEEYLKTQGEAVDLEGQADVWIVEFGGDFMPKRHPELGCAQMHVTVDAETGSVLEAGCR